jgi:hypothetical protein
MQTVCALVRRAPSVTPLRATFSAVSGAVFRRRSSTNIPFRKYTKPAEKRVFFSEKKPIFLAKNG